MSSCGAEAHSPTLAHYRSFRMPPTGDRFGCVEYQNIRTTYRENGSQASMFANAGTGALDLFDWPTTAEVITIRINLSGFTDSQMALYTIQTLLRLDPRAVVVLEVEDDTDMMLDAQTFVDALERHPELVPFLDWIKLAYTSDGGIPQTITEVKFGRHRTRLIWAYKEPTLQLLRTADLAGYSLLAGVDENRTQVERRCLDIPKRENRGRERGAADQNGIERSRR
ncbi:hypothetical protein BKA62DRAFT_801227 [Auriculariales sp. MPI-PUGE-AT-0066]|nr:hypothetical protein BKA62DRAFT_801227 [Auriculariales sp. MPI-PUGE-AT-0066]